MSDNYPASQADTKEPNSPSRRIVAAAFIVVLGIGILWLGIYVAHQRSVDYLRGLEKLTAKEETNEQADLVVELETLNKLGRANLVEVAVSTSLLGRLVEELDGLSFEIQANATDKIQVRLGKPRADFRDGFPRLNASGQAKFRQYPPLEVVASVVLRPELQTGAVVLHLRCLGLAPMGGHLPGWAATIASAEAARAANTELAHYPIRLPVQSEIDVPFDKVASIETPVKTDNGQVVIRIDLPTPPTVKRWMQPREVFFGRDALHAIVELRAEPPRDSPIAISASLAVKPVTTADELNSRLAPWRLAPDLSCSARIGRDVLLGLLTEVNKWPENLRTVTAQGLREDGHLKDTTGGPPLGNGFSAWLDGPDRLKATVILREFKPEWDAPQQQIPLHLTASASAQGQIHVHGHAPHIDPPSIFGVKIGGGATIGGGVGTSVGVQLIESTNNLVGVIKLDPATGVFEVSLSEPNDLIFKVRAGGIPDALMELFKVGLKVPLPHDKPLTTFRVPTIVSTEVTIPAPGTSGEARHLSLHVEKLQASLEPESLLVTSRVTASDGAVTKP